MDDLAMTELLLARGSWARVPDRRWSGAVGRDRLRPGETRIATVKIDAAGRVLATTFVRHCQCCRPVCTEGPDPVPDAMIRQRRR